MTPENCNSEIIAGWITNLVHGYVYPHWVPIFIALVVAVLATIPSGRIGLAAAAGACAGAVVFTIIAVAIGAAANWLYALMLVGGLIGMVVVLKLAMNTGHASHPPNHGHH